VIGLRKPKLCTKFEVASVSHYRSIKGKPQILAQGHAHFLLWV